MKGDGVMVSVAGKQGNPMVSELLKATYSEHVTGISCMTFKSSTGYHAILLSKNSMANLLPQVL